MRSEGFTLGSDQEVRVDIVRLMLDDKMAGILSEAGGASCQLCKATHKELSDRELIIQGFLSTGTLLMQFNFSAKKKTVIYFLTSFKPTWFTLLIYHLSCGKCTWSPTSLAIKNSMIFVRNLIEKKTRMRIDQPNASGGTSSTGTVARRAFSCDSKYIECVLVLAHSEEILIEFNLVRAPKSFSEEGSEVCNKLLRKYGENLASKSSFEDNAIDIFVRLASESDPVLNQFRSSLVCERLDRDKKERDLLVQVIKQRVDVFEEEQREFTVSNLDDINTIHIT
ncbi:hypothetical protein LOD99_4029 [Oopsacas minuta]|uniref:Uncharacterized protein n=1 Tax=Oopsacas minuta TaxID=111878 RepID=A0AAV7JVK9_9METZ|nr:hypothetical protein LOD99_4029 [Oopsacas minuta]